jgi:hypothetical protein
MRFNLFHLAKQLSGLLTPALLLRIVFKAWQDQYKNRTPNPHLFAQRVFYLDLLCNSTYSTGKYLRWNNTSLKGLSQEELFLSPVLLNHLISICLLSSSEILICLGVLTSLSASYKSSPPYNIWFFLLDNIWSTHESRPTVLFTKYVPSPSYFLF